ncbi:sulfur oxidation c-type cytochrome SoxX [Undibacterium sp.]|uniref:sulfur oxidation c-type cytochrome SoxX n=1 Tax=Undibacterium sp. TaxID=1914977 RepID=UPI00374DEB97
MHKPQAATGRSARAAACLFFLMACGSAPAQQSAGAAIPVAAAPASAPASIPALVAYKLEGDAIPLPLTGAPGDAARGRTIVASRQQGLCLLCHTGPIPEERFQGNLAPDLAGAGSRWSEGQLRLRMVDARRFNATTIMPSYYRTQDLERTAAAWQGKPVLSAQQIEDVVAFLVTLKGDDGNNSGNSSSNSHGEKDRPE